MFIVVLFISSTGLAIVVEADLLGGTFSSEKSCRYKLVVSTSFWSRLLIVSSVLKTKKVHSDNFFLCCLCVNALWACWRFMGVLSF